MRNPFRARAAEAQAAAAHEAFAEQNAKKSTWLAARAAELGQQSERFDRVVLDHQVAERREAERVAAIETRLTTAAAALQKADKAAAGALGRLAEAARSYDDAVAEADRELRAAGLVARYADGGEAVDFPTGGAGRDGVVLAGKAWVRVNTPDVLRRAVHATLRGLGDRTTERDSARWRKLDWSGLLSPMPEPATRSSWTPELAEAMAAQSKAMASSPPSPRAIEDHEARVRRDEHEQRQNDARLARHLAAVAAGEVGLFA
jgi:hypothetical protein